MTAASDKELSALHKKVAQVMLNALNQQTAGAVLLREAINLDRSDEDDVAAFMGKIIDFLADATEVNPALLQAVTKFLRDNDITAEIEDSEELSELKKTLSAKRRSVGNVIPISDE